MEEQGGQYSMSDNIKCFVCAAEVNFGDDYQEHLSLVHNIRESIPFFMNKALKDKMNTKNKTSPVPVEVLDVDDEESMKSLPNEKESKYAKKLTGKSFERKAIAKVDSTMTKMFAPIVDFCNERSDGKEEMEATLDEYSEIMEAFNDLRTSMKSQTIKKCIFKNMKQRTKSATVEENIAETERKENSPSEKKQVEPILENSCPSTPVMKEPAPPPPTSTSRA